MARPRKSLHTHLKAGTFRPDRHGDRAQRVQPMDPTPPPHLCTERTAAWHELVRAGEQYLAQSDRFAVELAAGLVVRARTGDVKAADIAQLVGLLGRLGLTPAGRRGLEPVRDPDADANPFDRIDLDS